MAAAAESASFEEEHVPNKKPRKECLLKGISNVPDSESEESEFYDVSRNKSDGSDPPADWAHVHPDLEDLDGEVSSMLEAVTFAELQTASVSEVEDWDKELEDFECSPYALSSSVVVHVISPWTKVARDRSSFIHVIRVILILRFVNCFTIESC
nr:coordinator of PRMT5 and differentiation stimulator isoform X4 [Columba livia]